MQLHSWPSVASYRGYAV